MAKRAALGDFTSNKGQIVPMIPATTSPAPDDAEKKSDNRVRLSLRLGSAPMRQLKQLGLDEGVTAHDLLIEALDDLFGKRGKPRIATDEQPRTKS